MSDNFSVYPSKSSVSFEAFWTFPVYERCVHRARLCEPTQELIQVGGCFLQPTFPKALWFRKEKAMAGPKLLPTSGKQKVSIHSDPVNLLYCIYFGSTSGLSHICKTSLASISTCLTQYASDLVSGLWVSTSKWKLSQQKHMFRCI